MGFPDSFLRGLSKPARAVVELFQYNTRHTGVTGILTLTQIKDRLPNVDVDRAMIEVKNARLLCTCSTVRNGAQEIGYFVD